MHHTSKSQLNPLLVLRSFLQDVFDTRDSGWKLRRKAEGPKRIEEVHKEAMRDASLNPRAGPPRGFGHGGQQGYDDRYDRGGYPPRDYRDRDRAPPLQETLNRPLNLGGFTPRQNSSEMSFRPQSFGMKGPMAGRGHDGPPPPRGPPPPPDRHHSAPTHHSAPAPAPAPPPAAARPSLTTSTSAPSSAPAGMDPAKLKLRVKGLVEEYHNSKDVNDKKDDAALALEMRELLATHNPAPVLINTCIKVRKAAPKFIASAAAFAIKRFLKLQRNSFGCHCCSFSFITVLSYDRSIER